MSDSSDLNVGTICITTQRSNTANLLGSFLFDTPLFPFLTLNSNHILNLSFRSFLIIYTSNKSVKINK